MSKWYNKNNTAKKVSITQKLKVIIHLNSSWFKYGITLVNGTNNMESNLGKQNITKNYVYMGSKCLPDQFGPSWIPVGDMLNTNRALIWGKHKKGMKRSHPISNILFFNIPLKSLLFEFCTGIIIKITGVVKNTCTFLSLVFGVSLKVYF